MLAVALVLAQQITFTGPLPATPPPPPEEKTEQVTVRSKPPPRSASDWEVGPDTLQSVPHETGADVLGTLPGVYVSNRGLLGQAPTLSVRGFQGTSGENMELFLGSVPLNQLSNLRAPGYADMRLVMPEVIRSVRISHGPYDPRQGDFAIAGTAHMDLGLDQPGFLGEGTLGSFGTKRVVLAFAPDDERWGDSFAAVEAYGTDGPGSGRGGERASFVGQLGYSDHQFAWRSMIAMGTARFDFPGMLPLADVDRGEYPYSSISPLGRDLTTQAHLGNELFFEMNGGTLALTIYVSLTKMQMHEDLTGYALDVLAGLPPTNSDDAEQVNQATTYGLDVSYRRIVQLLTKRDILEVGAMTRIDSIDQSDTRLFPDGTIDVRNVDAHIDATSIAGYVDAALYPIPRVVIRGGTRLDSLSYSVTNHLGNEGIEQTSQGLHVGNKVTVDYASGRGVHLLASYGEGFRSPEALTVSEGQHIPFATIQSFEAGARVKSGKAWQASVVGFASWLSEDLVFDALSRTSMPAPSSQRVGGSAAGTMRQGIFGSSLSATYARAVFTGSDGTFQSGEAVPYAPTVVVRDDTFVVTPVGKIAGSGVVGRFGVGVQGAFGATLPGGGQEIPAMYVDALAAAAWRSFELSLNGMNLLDRRYYDAEYVYSSNFQKSATLPPPTAHVLVAPPASVFLTLKVRLGGKSGTEGG
ncbi:MAG TPA: TonB-dependent receptor plug domain-containing protein [Polyangiaceae bacterium]